MTFAVAIVLGDTGSSPGMDTPVAVQPPAPLAIVTHAADAPAELE
jgi:hypothetical protein